MINQMTENKPMKLKELTIRLQRSYEDNPGKYMAEIEYEGTHGTVKVLLGDRVSDALLACVGPAISEFSHRASEEIEKNLQWSIQEASKAPAIEVESTA